MFGSTYAVSWTGLKGNSCAGRLRLDGRALVLTGGSNGWREQETMPVREIDDIQVRNGRLYITKRNGRLLSIGSLDAPGILRELAERLAICGRSAQQQ